MQVSTKRFGRGALWGLAGTVAMTLAMLFIKLIGGAELLDPLPLSLGARVLARVLGAAPTASSIIVLAAIVHFSYGAFWGGLVAASTRHMTAWKGIALGTGLWVVMLIFFVPMVAQTFSAVTNPAMWVVTFALHAVYGGVTGALIERYPAKESDVGADYSSPAAQYH